MLPVGDPDQGGEVAGVFGDVLDVNPLTAGAAVSAVVQGIGHQAGGAEPLRDVVVAAGMFAEPVGQDHHTFGGTPVEFGVHVSYTMRTPPTPSKVRSARVVWISGI